MTNRLPGWETLRSAAPDHVRPPPKLTAKEIRKHPVAYRAFRLECACGHITVWAATEGVALSKWMNHLAVVSGVKKIQDHRKVTPGSHPRGT